MRRLKSYFPIVQWASTYQRAQFSSDATAALIVTIMLIPQSMAYALLAGLPPHIGLYASILPLIGYMIFGTSNALAVGPVAVVSLMTAASVGTIAETGTAGYLAAAIMLALLSGGILLVMGLLRLGFLSDFLSHPVVSGFITASGILIAFSQMRHILGVEAGGYSLLEIINSLLTALPDTNWVAVGFGVPALGFLFWVRGSMKAALQRLGLSATMAGNLAKAGPLLAVFISVVCVHVLQLDQALPLVGAIPNQLPALAVPAFNLDLMQSLLLPALLISAIGFVESVSVARTLAARDNQYIDPNQELIGLGSANVLSSLSGGYPVTGGLARSVVNLDAGAVTPAAGGLTAIGIALATVFFTPYLYFLPKAILAATIIVAVLSLVDFSVLKSSWVYSKSDFAAAMLTILVTLFAGVELGVSTGAAASIALYLITTSQPHIAEIGLVPDTQHFRNVVRHKVITSPSILSLRVDENLFFANALHIEKHITSQLDGRPELRHVVLNCSSVSLIDSSALEVLEVLNTQLMARAIQFHLVELKGPVEDRLRRQDFIEHLSGTLFLHQYQAVSTLDPKTYPPLSLSRSELVEAIDGSHI